MTTEYTAQWAGQVVAMCDPVFAAADVGFVSQLMTDPDGRVTALLWEATPTRFHARYPDSEVAESYGDAWPDDVHCIDFWVYLDRPGQARISVEGWSLPDLLVDLSGNLRENLRDGHNIRAVFARILNVPLQWD